MWKKNRNNGVKMRIAFTGSGGTGKTTLLNIVNEYLKLPVIDENIRPWLKKNGFVEFKDMTFQDVKRMQHEVMYAKIKEEINLNTFISDRTTIDNAMYTLRWVSSLTNEYNDWYKLYLKDARMHARSYYDIIFVLPHGVIQIENDGLRSSKTWYQFLMQELIENEINKLETACRDPYIHHVTSSRLNDRVEECLEIYNKVKTHKRLYVI